MRFTLQQILLIAVLTTIGYARESNSQNILRDEVMLRMSNSTLTQVLKRIEDISSAEFTYNHSVVKHIDGLDIDYDNQPLEVVLDEILLPRGLDYTVLYSKNIVIKRRLASQAADTVPKVTGIVEDNDGNPIIGATIVIEGSAAGTVTDFDGQFEISAEQGDVLQVSYIGFSSKEVPIESIGDMLTIALSEDILQLDELTVTGSSSATSKKELGNAIATIEAKEIENSGTPNITSALSGKFSGALVSQNSGNPAGGVSVRLRGASTVYGSSDPLYLLDGVIIDNTSTELLPLGGYAQNRLVDINPRDIERVEVIKGAAAAAIFGSRASNGVVQLFTKKGKAGDTRVNFSSSFKLHQVRKQIEENQEPFRFEAPGSSVLVPTERYAMQDRIFRDAFGMDHYLSVGGGSEKTQFFTSASYSYNEGIIRNTDFERITVRTNINHTFNDWLIGSVNASYATNTSQELPNGGMRAPNEFFGVLTGFAFLNTDYNPDRQEDGSYINNLGFTLAANPVAAIETYDFNQGTDRFIGSLRLAAFPIENLEIEYILGYDGNNSQATAYIPIGILPKVTGWSRRAEKTLLYLNNDLNVKYSYRLSSAIRASSSIGVTQQYDRSSVFALTADRLSPAVQTTVGGTPIARTDERTERSIRGGFFQQTFHIHDRLNITGAVRVDQASTFGADERTQVYPKVNFSYLLSDEGFWSNSLSTVFPVFKLRGSYGEAGNLTALSAFERENNFIPVAFGGQTGFVPSTQAGNLNLKPERQKELEVGFDASTLNGKLGIEFTYFDVKVEDLLLSRVLAPTTTFETRLENVGTLTNKGFEVLVKALAVDAKDFKWNIVGTYTTNRNEVNGIEGGQLVLPDVFDQAVVAKDGEAIGVFSGTYFLRNDDGSIRTENGLPLTSADKKIIGDPNPDWVGSLINTFSYRNWGLRVQFDAVMGFDVFNWTDRLNSHTDLFGGGANDAAEIRGDLPRGYNAATFQIFERYIEDGSFIKLRELSLTYSPIIASEAIESLRFALIGRNLLSIDDYSGWDPEVSSFGQRNGIRGMDFNEVPIPRTIEFNVSIGL